MTKRISEKGVRGHHRGWIHGRWSRRRARGVASTRRGSPKVLVGLVAMLLTVACGAQDPASDTDVAWVGSITTDGDVTTVVNESGSVWGGTATLVQEASIGVESGDDPYILGHVGSLAASADRIYVLDTQIPAVRAYDWAGAYVQDLGRAGAGPGEYQYPRAVGVDGAAQVWVHDVGSLRLVVFSSTGEAITTVALGGGRASGGNPMVLTTNGHAYIFDVVFPPEADRSGSPDLRRVMRPYGLDGPTGAPLEIPRFDPAGFLTTGSSSEVMRFAAIPFHPTGVTAVAPWPAVLSGYPDDYRFQISYPDGKQTMIARVWEPVAVDTSEAAAHEAATIAYMREIEPGWVWSGSEIPSTKPAYSTLVPTQSGEIWVERPGPASLDPDCEEESFELDGTAHCWRQRRTIDVFEAAGRYLGEVSVPPNFSLRPQPYIRGNDVVARVEDGAGTIMVKRYRLVVPRESP